MSTARLHEEIAACRVCEKALGFAPRPVVQFSATSRILIIGQAPGSKVHASGIGWDDASGDRLRDWTGLSRDRMYDSAQVALVPMGFCYPGKASGGDKPPRPECAPLWHDRVQAKLPEDRLTLLVGMHAQKAYLPDTKGWTMARRVEHWCESEGRDWGDVIPLPHPSWRSTIFMRQNPWFEAEVVPLLREKVAARLAA